MEETGAGTGLRTNPWSVDDDDHIWFTSTNTFLVHQFTSYYTFRGYILIVDISRNINCNIEFAERSLISIV